MYYGEYITTVDEKGRITVPRRIRERMDAFGHAIWYATRGFDHSIFLIHRDEWLKIHAQVAQFSSMDAKVLDFRRLFFSSVAEVKPDNQGRLAIAQHLREHAGLEREAVLLGVGDHLELWNRESWRNFVEGKEAEYKQMAIPVFSRGEAAAGGRSHETGTN